MHLSFHQTTIMVHQTTLITYHTVQQVACDQLLSDTSYCVGGVLTPCLYHTISTVYWPGDMHIIEQLNYKKGNVGNQP